MVKYLASTQVTVGGYCFIYGFLKQIKAICFVSDWRKKGQETGGKKYKTNFAQMVYHSCPGKVPPDKETSLQDELKAFCAFKLSQCRSITSRNHLLDMYQEVMSP